jgi:hypothetical protein
MEYLGKRYMVKHRIQFTKILVCMMLSLGLVLWPIYGYAQGSHSTDEGATDTGGMKIYLPMLVNMDAANTGSEPYTGPPPENPTWLEYINYYRSLAGLAAVDDNSSWSQGDWLHSRYMVKNDFIGHSEDPGNTWFSSEGDLAARTSNLLASSSHTASDLSAIDGWIQAPFHGVGILDPQLGQVGFGSFREQDGGFQMGAALDVLRGLQDLPDSIQFPIAWPGNGASVPITSHTGEYPNPLSSCSGYSSPAGLPIILQIGAGEITPRVTSHSFKLGNLELPHCVFDETSYNNPDNSAESLGRAILNFRDAIVLIPKDPLIPGNTYSVSVTVNGDSHRWSFSTLDGKSQTQPVLTDTGIDWHFSLP